MKRIGYWVTWVGLVLSAIYLVAALFLAARFAIDSSDKDNALKRIVAASTGHDAVAFAQPTFDQMLAVIRAARIALRISCALIFLNLIISVVTLVTDKHQANRESNGNPSGM